MTVSNSILRRFLRKDVLSSSGKSKERFSVLVLSSPSINSLNARNRFEGSIEQMTFLLAFMRNFSWFPFGNSLLKTSLHLRVFFAVAAL